VRFDASAFESRLRYLYARLRMRVVERLAGVPAIYTGGARGEISSTFAQGGAVYGLIDVPSGTAGVANATLFGAPVFWPSGLVEAARAANADVLLLTARCDTDGRRHVAAERIAAADVGDIAARFGARIDAAPGAWHVWHFLPDFAAAADVEAQALL
jgi:lauroyl/myristoyl acyltransferase